jgi:hypothetical protein
VRLRAQARQVSLIHEGKVTPLSANREGNALARISHEKIEKGCLFWHKHFDEKNLRQRTETAL